jgi:hypothetical protein
MAITVKHKFVSAIPDAGDPTIVQPSNWNDSHDLVGTVPVANGGTGAATANAGFNALAPSQTGNSGKYLTTDGTDTSWATNPLGTVTSVAATVPAFLNVSGSPITTSGTLALTYSGTALPVANGGTGVTTSSGANSVVLRDANVNINANAFNDGYTNTAASGTQIVLTAASVRRYTITGSGGQTIKLPDATTLSNGEIFEFDNNQSSGAITVNNNSNTLVVSVPSGGLVRVNLLSNAIAAGSWDRHDYAPANVSWSTNTFDYAGSITSATWNGNTIQVNRGGTGATTLTGYVKGSGTSALTAASTIPTTDLSGTITNAQLANSAITINGTSTSLGGSVSVGTVTSVAATAGTGISVTGSPITSSGTLNITNTAPDQTVVLTAGTGISTTGTYPNFTITNTSPSSGGTVTSVTGTAPVVSSGGNTPAISMPAATTSVSGYLTSTDWNTFNGKQAAGTYVNSVSGTTGRITSTGGVTPVIDLASGVATAGTTGSSTLIPVVTIDTYGRVTGITTASNPQGTVTSVTGTAPVVSSGGATPAISMPAATSSVNGYLTSTDWTTFNNKSNTNGTVTSVAALTLGTTGTDLSSTVANGTTTPVITLQVPTASATNRGALSSADWSTFNGKAPAVTYTTNYVPYGQGTTTPNQSSSFTFDGTTQTAPVQRASNGIITNSQTISASYTIPSTDNAVSSGPVTVASGQTVTVSSGSRWVIL